MTRRGFLRRTLMRARVDSASFTSAGLALVSWLPKGIPEPSTTTIHFVPFPRLVFPTPEPLFCGSKTSVQKTLAPIQPPSLIEFAQEDTPDFQPHPTLLPCSQSS